MISNRFYFYINAHTILGVAEARPGVAAQHIHTYVKEKENVLSKKKKLKWKNEKKRNIKKIDFVIDAKIYIINARYIHLY